jgi:hypothetical protein
MKFIAPDDFDQGFANPLKIPSLSNFVTKGTIFSIGGSLPPEEFVGDDLLIYKQFLAAGRICPLDSDRGKEILATVEIKREITYKWTPELVRIGTRRFIFRYAGRSLFGFLTVLAIGVAGLMVDNGEGFFWFITVLPFGYALIWVRYYFRVTKMSYGMTGRNVTVRVEPESITFQTSEHISTMKWSLIKKLWSFPDVLLVFTYSPLNYSMIPVAPLGEELRCFIEGKVKKHGGKVVK